MPSLKDLKNRINSVKSTQKITSAMKMVAAAKLRRAQEQAEASRPFAERMERVVGALAANMAGQEGAPAMLAGTWEIEAREPENRIERAVRATRSRIRKSIGAARIASGARASAG